MKKTFFVRRYESLRRSTILRLPWVVLLTLAGIPTASAQTISTYSVNNLGTLTGFTSPTPSSINNLGQVAGTAANYSPYPPVGHPFRTEPNSPINPATDDLGLLSGATFGSASGINNLGQVAGTDTGYSDFHGEAFRADPGNSTLVDLGLFSGTLSGLGDSDANGINDAGQITGAATVPVPFMCFGFTSHAFRTLPNGPLSTAEDLGTLKTDDCLFSVGYAINASGQVVGYSTSFASPQEAFLATPGMAMEDLLASLGGPFNTAYAINNAGQVVGASNLGINTPYYDYYNAFLESPGSSNLDLGTLGGSYSWAYGINNGGEIVGSSTLPGDTASHAFIYQSGTMTDLNELIPAGSGWVLENASAINDFGQIVGTGTLNGAYAAYRLDPVASEQAPTSGTDCNGTYSGTFNGDITVSTGQVCRFLSGTIKGKVKLVGGTLSLKNIKLLANMLLKSGQLSFNEVTVTGNVDLQGGDAVFTDSTVAGNVDATGGTITFDPSTIDGNLQISNLPAGSAVSEVCGTTIKGNVQVSGNAAPVMIGQGGACAGNTISGNLQVEDNAAAMAVVDNTVSGNLQCSGNASITPAAATRLRATNKGSALRSKSQYLIAANAIIAAL
jgi:probable HAF family extracellular repeat protein